MNAYLTGWTELRREGGELGIVTDCMHPTTSGNRDFDFRDSVDLCGLLGMDIFPLVVVTG